MIYDISSLRRKDRALTKEEALQLITESQVGRLATIGIDGYPTITPYNYILWNDKIIIHTGLNGTTLNNIYKDNRVTFEVEYVGPVSWAEKPCDFGQFYKSVIIKGKADIIVSEEKIPYLIKLMEKFESNRTFNQEDFDEVVLKRTSVILITIESFSGKGKK